MTKKTTSAKKSLYTPEAEALLDKIFGSAESAEASEIKEEIEMTKENTSAKKVNLQKVDTAAESVDTAQDNISVYDLIPSVDELNDVEIDEATESVDTAAEVEIEIDEAAAAEALAKAAKKAAKKAKVKLRYKNGRWVKVTQDAAFTQKNNEMRLLLNEDQTYAIADVLYTANTSTYSKAANWLTRYLGHAEAADIIALAQSTIEAQCLKADNTPGAKKINIKGAGWQGTIEKIARGQFKIHLEWQIAA